MSLFNNVRRGRGMRWLVAGVFILLWVMPVLADVIVTSATSTASSSATTWGSGTYGGTATYTGANSSAFHNANAFDGNGENAQASSHASLSLSSPDPLDGNQILTGHVDTSGNSKTNSFYAYSSGSADVSGSFTLNEEYAYTLTAQGVTYADATNWQNSSSDSSVNLPGIGGSSGNSNWNSTGGSGWAGHTYNTGSLTGVLAPGNYSFDAHVDGNTSNISSWSNDSGNFGNFGKFTGATYPDSADFTLQLTPVPIPEPTTMMLLGAGLMALAGYAWRRRQVAA